MADETTHEDNATPETSDDDVKRMDADTEQDARPGASVGEGAGASPAGGGADEDVTEDPKAGHKGV